MLRQFVSWFMYKFFNYKEERTIVHFSSDLYNCDGSAKE